jgi:hypothetical protein
LPTADVGQPSAKGFFIFFWNFFADGLGRRHTIFADGQPSAKLWSLCRRPASRQHT